jgi:hypothetical protein
LNEEGLPLSLAGHEEVITVNSGVKNIERIICLFPSMEFYTKTSTYY